MVELLDSITEQIHGTAAGHQADQTLDPRQDAFETLGLKEGANPKNIKASFRKLSRAYHPDLASTSTPEIQKLAEEQFKKINWAYQTLITS